MFLLLWFLFLSKNAPGVRVLQTGNLELGITTSQFKGNILARYTPHYWVACVIVASHDKACCCAPSIKARFMSKQFFRISPRGTFAAPIVLKISYMIIH